MSEVTTTRPVNLRQLAVEAGGKPLTSHASGGSTTITCHDATTTAALQTAVDAHVAINEDGNRTTLEQQAATAMQGNRDFLAVTSPTAAQTAAQVKALTRQNNAVIRLLLGKLDATT